MVEEKFFYKYQEFKKSKDKKDEYPNNTIKNLANNQLFFKSPAEFNDPFDSRAYCFYRGTKKQFVDSIRKVDSISYEQAEAEFELDISNEIVEKQGEFYYAEYKKLFSKDIIHGDIPKEMYPKICCFSGTCKSILMWSHYADSHRGICLRFRSLKKRLNKKEYDYYLEFCYSNQNEMLWLARINPFHNLYYEVIFQKIVYNNNIPEPVNLFDKDGNIKLHNFLLNKFTDWVYEEEYRMIVDPDVDKMLLSEEEFKRGLVKYQKEDLEGIIFGLKINRKDVQDVYNTIKKHYLDEEITVNFYKAVEIDRKYDLKIEHISNMDEYIKSRPDSND